jgi:murein DD-endopeptidase MepM/ murein hydrolase activator NlpD
LKTGLGYKSFIIFLSIITAIMLILPANALVTSEIEKEKIKQKINELKQKEKIEINKLTKTQRNLERTERSIKSCENELWKSRMNLSKLQSKHNSMEREHKRLVKTVNKRIREMYKGERINILHVVFSAQDLSALFDRLYYQKSLIKKDKQFMSKLKQKTDEIIRTQRSINYEKRTISSSLQEMNRKKRSLDYSAQTSEYLISKLRTDREAYEQAQKELANLSKDIEKDISKRISSETILDSVFLRPVVGYISSPFGWRRHPIFGSRRFHSGVDLAGANGSPIKASNSGKVIHSGWYGGYGKVVIINHGVLTEGPHAGKKVSTLYAHMSRTIVDVGNYIKKGQVVGYEGSTGYSTGPHLHFEVRIDGKPTNPLEFIKR